MIRLVALTLLVASPAVTQSRAGQSKVVKLKPTTLKLAAALPITVRHRITDRLPESLAGEGFAAAVHKGKLEVDTTGDGRRDRKLTGKKPVVLNVGKDPVRPILVFKLFDTWFAGAARCLAGKYGRRAVTLLDADLDGQFATPADYIRFGGGSFHLQDPIRLLAEDDVLARYEFVADKPSLRLTPIAKPAQYNPLQWRALHAANHLRSHVGLSPLELDEQRSDGCQKHANYLLLNNYDYSKPWDGVGSHNEVPGNPGYTKEGHHAARTHATGGLSDAAKAITDQGRTMMHRTVFLGAVGGGLGVGAVDESKNRSADGYSVVGGDKPDITKVKDIVVVPAPGQQRVERICQGERPRPDRIANFYQKTRGYPISVSYGRLAITGSSFEVYTRKGNRLRPVAGSTFTREKPVSRTRPTNAESAFFVADGPLDVKTTYVVRFRAKNGGIPIELAWEFTTR